MSWGRDCCRWVFLRELWQSSHMLVQVQMCVRISAGALDSQNEPVLSLEFDRWTDAGLWKLMSTTEKLKRQKESDITTWIHAVRPGQWKEKANWKQSKYVYFSVSLILFSCSCFRIGDGSDDEELVNRTQRREDVPDIGVPSATPQLLWGLAGDRVTACYTLPPMTSSVCLGPVTLPEVKTWSDRWSHCKRKLTESWAHNSGLLTDMMESFLSQRRAIMDFSPPPYEVLKPFLMDYLLLHLHLLYCVSLFLPISFYKCVFYCFSFWFLLDLYLFSSFAFLFWCGLDCACSVFEVMSSVSPSWVCVLFQSSVLIWWCLCFY